MRNIVIIILYSITILEHENEDIGYEEAEKIVKDAVNACKVSDALEALNIGIPKRNTRSRPRLALES